MHSAFVLIGNVRLLLCMCSTHYIQYYTMYIFQSNGKSQARAFRRNAHNKFYTLIRMHIDIYHYKRCTAPMKTSSKNYDVISSA